MPGVVGNKHDEITGVNAWIPRACFRITEINVAAEWSDAIGCRLWRALARLAWAPCIEIDDAIFRSTEQNQAGIAQPANDMGLERDWNGTVDIAMDEVHEEDEVVQRGATLAIVIFVSIRPARIIIILCTF